MSVPHVTRIGNVGCGAARSAPELEYQKCRSLGKGYSLGGILRLILVNTLKPWLEGV